MTDMNDGQVLGMTLTVRVNCIDADQQIARAFLDAVVQRAREFQ